MLFSLLLTVLATLSASMDSASGVSVPSHHRSRRSTCPKSSVSTKNTTTTSTTKTTTSKTDTSSSSSGSCFPALDFKMPSEVPSSTDGWWCDAKDEYAFLGYSYEITACQSKSQLNSEFKDIRTRFNSRYIRLYGFCDNENYYNDVVDAAWENGLGVHALIWFGFDGGNQWETRRDNLVKSLTTYEKAKFVTRVVQFGSEPLYDSVLTPSQLTSQVNELKSKLKGVGIPVTVSELAYGYQENNGAQDVLDAIDSINAHVLPFFAGDAKSGADAWGDVMDTVNFFVKNGGGKKIYFDENGWPSQQSSGVQANSKSAVADVSSESAYFKLLDSKCSYLKTLPQGGAGWFAHIYSDDQEPGYGIYDSNGKMKFSFSPKTEC